MRQKVDFRRCFSPWAKTTCPPPPRTQANLLPKSVLLFFPCCWVFPRLSSRNDWRLAWLANLCPPRSPSCMCLGAFGGFHSSDPRSYHFPPAPYRSLRYTIWLPVSLGGIPGLPLLSTNGPPPARPRSHSAPRSPCRAPSSVAGGCRDHQWPPSCCHTPMLLRSLPSVGVQ